MNKVLTLTLNPAIDLTVSIDALQPGAVHRARGQQLEAGGKGVGVASVLAGLGVPVATTGWLGADNAALFEAVFAARGIADRMLRVPGATRTNIKLADAARGDSTDINLPGITLDAQALAQATAQLREVLRVQLAPGDWCVLAGSLPPGVGADLYVQLAQDVAAGGAHLVLDTGGALLGQVLEGLRRAAPQALPAFLKPNRAELEEFAGQSLTDVPAIARAAQGLCALGVQQVVVSLGADGAVLASAGGSWHATPPKVPVATSVGAGDALVAGTLAAFCEGRGFPEAAVFGMACAAARVQRIAATLPPRADIDTLAGQVRLSKL